MADSRGNRCAQVAAAARVCPQPPQWCPPPPRGGAPSRRRSCPPPPQAQPPQKYRLTAVASAPLRRGSVGARCARNPLRRTSVVPPLSLRFSRQGRHRLSDSHTPPPADSQENSFDRKKFVGFSGVHFSRFTRLTRATKCLYVELVTSALFVASQRKSRTRDPMPYRMHTWAI